jgi:cytochrome c553
MIKVARFFGGRHISASCRRLLRNLTLIGVAWTTSASLALAGEPAPDSIELRVRACTVCHGPEGRAAPDGYYPRIAGKPAGYLFQQLLSFRDGRRRYAPMTHLLDTLPDTYLLEMARYFAALDLPYPPPRPASAPSAWLDRGRELVTRGDPAHDVPACNQCHGEALTGFAPAVPGLLGLPRDYLNAQLGAWRSGQRRAFAPDCMAQIAGRLSPQDIGAVAAWLSSQPLPSDTKAVRSLGRKPPMECGSLTVTEPAAGK